MNANSQRCVLTASALAMSLQGCAGISENKPLAAFDVRPSQAASTSMAPSDGLYRDAAAAIYRSDYARALDLLQAARVRGGEDARILNAFGVVYDKLGRFDLSQRYYAGAQALDPTSRIVAQNLTYSQVLQGESTPAAMAAAEASAAPVDREARELLASAPEAPPATAPAALAASPAVSAITSSPPTSIAAVEPPVVRLAATMRPTLIQAPSGPPPSAGRPARVADMGGERHADPLRMQPARRSWTLASVNGRIAHAFARGLRFLLNRESCRSGCSSIKVTLEVKRPLHMAGSTSGDTLHLG